MAKPIIGAGSFSSVVCDRTANVAVKRFGRGLFAAAVKEIAVARACNHDNIVKHLHIARGCDGIKIYMPLYESDMRVPRWFGKPSAAVDFTRAVLDVSAACSHMAAKNIIHGDLKPANILYSKTKRAVVCDFNLSVVEPTDTMTATLLTADYRAPNIDLADGTTPTDPTIDTFALGCIMFEWLTGAKLFKHATNNSKANYAAVFHNANVDATSLAKWINASAYCRLYPKPFQPAKLTRLIELIAECLQWSPVSRITAPALHAALCELAGVSAFDGAAATTEQSAAEYRQIIVAAAPSKAALSNAEAECSAVRALCPQFANAVRRLEVQYYTAHHAKKILGGCGSRRVLEACIWLVACIRDQPMALPGDQSTMFCVFGTCLARSEHNRRISKMIQIISN